MTERRPIEKVGGSFKPEKFAWLWQVARDPAAQYGMPLAVQLVLGHVNNEHWKCNPGDEKLSHKPQPKHQDDPAHAQGAARDRAPSARPVQNRRAARRRDHPYAAARSHADRWT